MQNNYNRVYKGQQSGKTDVSIVDLLKTGKENAISTKELLRLSGCKNTRTLQERIAEERSAEPLYVADPAQGIGYPKTVKR